MIKVRFDDSGFRELQRKLKELSETKQVPVSEFFNTPFMTKYTSYSSLEAMLEAANLAPESITNAESLRENESWNRFIADNTRFKDWNDMLEAALLEHVKLKLGLK